MVDINAESLSESSTVILFRIISLFLFFPVCHGSVIDNVAAAQKMKGCTIIEGVLEIQIRGGSEGMTLRLGENLLISIFNFTDCVLCRKMEGQF